MRTGLRFFWDSCDYLTAPLIACLLFVNASLTVSACRLIGLTAFHHEMSQEESEMQQQTEKFERMARERN